jgi:hypothetical protein
MMNDQHDQNKDPKQPGQQPDLFSELQTLGRQLEQTVRGILDHERVRSFQRDFFSGMQEFFSQMQGAVKTFQENQQVKEWTERGHQAFNQARENDTVKDFQQTVARGMANLNEQLGAFSQRTQQRQDSTSTDSEPSGSTPGTASESGTTPPPASEAGEQQPGAAANTDVFDELNKLRQNLEQSGRNVMSSENAQKMQHDITNNIQQLLAQAQKSVQSVQENPQVKEWGERGQEAVNQAQQNQVVRDLQQTMANSLAYFNQQLAEFRTRQEKQDDQAAQSVPIDIEEEDAAPRSAHTNPADAASGPATGIPGASGTPGVSGTPETGPTQKLDPDASSDNPQAAAQPAQNVPIDTGDAEGTGEDATPRSAQADPADAASGPATGVPGTSGTPRTGPTERLDTDAPDEGSDKPQQ